MEAVDYKQEAKDALAESDDPDVKRVREKVSIYFVGILNELTLMANLDTEDERNAVLRVIKEREKIKAALAEGLITIKNMLVVGSLVCRLR